MAVSRKILPKSQGPNHDGSSSTCRDCWHVSSCHHHYQNQSQPASQTVGSKAAIQVYTDQQQQTSAQRGHTRPLKVLAQPNLLLACCSNTALWSLSTIHARPLDAPRTSLIQACVPGLARTPGIKTHPWYDLACGGGQHHQVASIKDVKTAHNSQGTCQSEPLTHRTRAAGLSSTRDKQALATIIKEARVADRLPNPSCTSHSSLQTTTEAKTVGC